MSTWHNRYQLLATSAAPYHPAVILDDFINATHISLKYKYLFANNPKVGCSTIKKLLIDAEYEAKSELKEFQYIHYQEFAPLLTIRQIGNIPTFLARKDIFKFCFVRNPYTRLLSAYLDKMKKWTGEKESILIQMGYGNVEDREISFETFVEAVCAAPIRYMNQHWRVQYYQTFQKNIDFDFIGRFEQFEKDLEYVSNQIDVDFQQYYSKVLPHQTNAGSQLDVYYNDTLINKVYQKFKIDFEYFGYEKALPHNSA